MTIINRRALKTLTKNLTVHEWQLRTSSGQIIYIKHLYRGEQKRAVISKKTPIIRNDTQPTLHDRSELPRHVIVNLLNTFAQTWPLRLSGQDALWVLAEVLTIPQPTKDTIASILRDFAPRLSEEEQQAIISVCIKSLVLEDSESIP